MAKSVEGFSFRLFIFFHHQQSTVNGTDEQNGSLTETKMTVFLK